MTKLRDQAVAAPRVAARKLLHVWFADQPYRTFCGKPRDPASDPGEPYRDDRTSDDCIVCREMAEAYLVGRWSGA